MAPGLALFEFGGNPGWEGRDMKSFRLKGSKGRG